MLKLKCDGIGKALVGIGVMTESRKVAAGYYTRTFQVLGGAPGTLRTLKILPADF
jgi:hypothetical protein